MTTRPTGPQGSVRGLCDFGLVRFAGSLAGCGPAELLAAGLAERVGATLLEGASLAATVGDVGSGTAGWRRWQGSRRLRAAVSRSRRTRDRCEREGK